MKIPSFNIRRGMLAVLAGLSMSGACTMALAADPIKILVGFPAGGTIDVVARQVGDQMQADLGVPVVVENATGAGGQLAAQALKRAPADGHTLMIAPDHTMVIIPLTMAKPGFDVGKDFAPVGMVANYDGGLAVNEASGVKNVADFIAYVKAHPAAGSIGIPAPGSKPYFQLNAMGKQLNIAVTPVPYRGSAPLVQDLAAGQLFAGVTALGDFLEFQRAGKLKVIAITGERRAGVLPDVPTAMEQGQSMRMDFWIGMFAPAGTPKAMVDKLNQSLNKALASAKVRERMAQLAFDPLPTKPEALSQRMVAEGKYWAPLVAESGWTKQ